jgi:hypothetical protein
MRFEILGVVNTQTFGDLVDVCRHFEGRCCHNFRNRRDKRGAQQWPNVHPILRYILPDYRKFNPRRQKF